MAQPWLSILMPTCNGETYLPFALDSVIDQQETDIECIVIDDGSTDATLSILRTYQDRLPIKIVQRERQGNWVANTNHALSIAKGQYVCFLHQDDLWFEDRLAIMKQIIEQFPKVNFFIHSCEFIDKENKSLGIWQCPLPRFPEVINLGMMTEKLLIQNFISIPAPIFKREIALKVGGLDESLWYTADWDLWLKIAACSDTLYYPKPLAGFRIHPSSQTMVRSSYLQDFRKQLESVAEKHLVTWHAHKSLKKSVFKSASFSIEVNAGMAGMIHNQKPPIFRLVILFLSLGFSGWRRYFRDSRIWERVSARLKVRLKKKI
ncbi:MAG TPA: glycosyltransferase [Candidatus Competibacteraceae bacterium]|nr:glycosyltransferase [Candidatus Competibacteraceae bacterium]MCP5132370.1 glycosyltransferase [Gammaproteobacteria bacterium]HPF59037.1 glycosyltransferase [Candidatus Competibacteraceae bacterium]